MHADKSRLPANASSGEVDAFLEQATRLPVPGRDDGRARLLFAMDATASREPTWDRACQIQAEMFSATSDLGGVDVKLCFYRGFRELRVSNWCTDADELLKKMSAVRCAGGMTQIGRVLQLALTESTRQSIKAMVFVGDCVEEEIDHLCDLAGGLGLLGLPVFIFHEGFDTLAERAFREIARLSRGAYCRFDTGSAAQLRDLLGAVAVYAAGGEEALKKLADSKGGVVKQLGRQLQDHSK